MDLNETKGHVCASLAQRTGGIAGSVWGFFSLFRAIFQNDGQGSLWLGAALSLLVAALGAILGVQAAGLLARTVLRSRVTTLRTVPLSTGLGLVAGAVVLAAVWLVFFVLAYYAGTVAFGTDSVVTLATNAVLLGLVIGGASGGLLGAAYGVFVSLYLRSR